MKLTDYLAIIGAITGIIGMFSGITALCWDYYKWRNSKRPHFKVRANGNMISDDPSDKQKYISVTVTNAGDKPVKLKMLTYHFFKEKPKKNNKTKLPDEAGFWNLINSNLVSAPLPHKIEVGDEWTVLLIQTEEIEKKVNEGFYYIVAEDSITDNLFDTARTLLELKSPKSDKN
jgi:hypothetical protein